MSVEIFKYLLSASYVLLVYWLSWQGMRRTRDISGFSIGNKDMSPYVIGITLAASIASTATFVINPGFVYTDGLSAWLHYGLAGSAGTVTAFLLLSRGFLRVGESFQALTLAQTGRIDRLSGGKCKSTDFDAAYNRMIPFVAAGFREVCKPSS